MSAADRPTLTILIPVKPLDAAKQRLSALLDPAERQGFARAMLHDALHLATHAPVARDAMVLTCDAAVRRIATAYGVRVMAEQRGAGLNPSLDGAAALLAREGVETLAILPADLPRASPGDVAELFAAHARRGDALTVAAARRDRGTNGLIAAPPDLIGFCFGPLSSVRHVEAARRKGRRAHAIVVGGLAYDVDTPDDVALLVQDGGPSHACDYLNGLGIAERLRRASARVENAT